MSEINEQDEANLIVHGISQNIKFLLCQRDERDCTVRDRQINGVWELQSLLAELLEKTIIDNGE